MVYFKILFMKKHSQSINHQKSKSQDIKRYRQALSAGQGKNNEVLQAWRPLNLIIKPLPIRALGEVIYFAYVKKGAKLCEPFPHTLLKFHPECGPTERETAGYWGAVRGKDWGRERERECKTPEM